MANASNNAIAAAVDEIAPVKDHAPEHHSSNPRIPTEDGPHSIGLLTLEDGPVSARTKIRTLAIVAALYMVLFIAALDQTIIA